MKSVGRPAKSNRARDDDTALVDQYLHESEYLPVRGDQSWREQAALRIAAGSDRNDHDEAPDTFPAREDRIADSDFNGRSRGGILVAFFMVAIIVPVIAVLAAPDILRAGFWSQHHAAVKARAEPAFPLARTADTPLRPSLAKGAAPKAPDPVRTAGASPLRFKNQGLNTGPSANALPKIAAVPKPRPASGTAQAGGAGDLGSGGFRSLVLGPDGTFKYQYFHSEPSTVTAERDETKDEGAGFYAKVASPDGTLRYQYFPSKPTEKERLAGMR